MKDKIDIKNFAKLAGLSQTADLLQRFGVPIGKVDGKQAIGRTRRINDRAHFGCVASERLLAKHGQAALERQD